MKWVYPLLSVYECLKIVLADANFPLDTYEKDRFILMEVVPGDPVVPVIWDEYKKILNEPVETGCVQQRGCNLIGGNLIK